MRLGSSAIDRTRRTAIGVSGRARASYSTARSFQGRLRQRLYLALGTLIRWCRETAGAAQRRVVAASRGIRTAIGAARDRGLAVFAAGRCGVQRFGMAVLSLQRASLRTMRSAGLTIGRALASAARVVALCVTTVLDGARRAAFFVIGRCAASCSKARSLQGRLRRGLYAAGRRGAQRFGMRVKSLQRAAGRAGNRGLASFGAVWRLSAKNLEKRAQTSLRKTRSAGLAIGRALASPVGVIAVSVTTVVVLMVPLIPRVMTVVNRVHVTTPTRESRGAEAPPPTVREAPTPSPAQQSGDAASAAARLRPENTVSTSAAPVTPSIVSSRPPSKKPVAPARRQAIATAVGPAATTRGDANVALRQPSTTTQPPPAYRGSLAVSSSPAGAQVFLNGVPAGLTPLLLRDLPVGSRVVRIELDGHERWSAATRIVANADTQVTAALRPVGNRQ